MLKSNIVHLQQKQRSTWIMLQRKKKKKKLYKFLSAKFVLLYIFVLREYVYVCWLVYTFSFLLPYLLTKLKLQKRFYVPNKMWKCKRLLLHFSLYVLPLILFYLIISIHIETDLNNYKLYQTKIIPNNKFSKLKIFLAQHCVSLIS